ncbi:hypothetical protein [Paraburkholderia sediminicola]|uniref:hypothetical protein n=1 Tax=Paraburkholderia sediminicola TaxID=458836 RepID=UPI0038BDF094
MRWASPKQPLVADPGPVQICVQVRLERVATGHLVALATFLAQPHNAVTVRTIAATVPFTLLPKFIVY